MIDWLSENSIGVLQIIIGGFIAYHVFFLSKQLSNKAKLEHKERIKKKAEELKSGKEVYLVNVKRYFKDYPSNKERMFSGYSHIKAEMKTTRFDGIEFFCGIKEIYRKPDGGLTLNGESEKTAQEKIKVFEIGVVPYEWIEYIDLRGDEHGFIPLFFCYFKGKRYWKISLKRHLPFGYPYKEIIYYRESEVYHEGSDPIDMKFRFIDEPVSDK
ncbi:MAG: hypothetical protein UW71_C0007G0006 [Parcubacteria group bacterium GW2011_GWB1_44_7]|nr:MAG: hypothetical protein UW71_C0007G0006 [Parcubacteria group bacterium GW2011_GWB1_44_7]